MLFLVLVKCSRSEQTSDFFSFASVNFAAFETCENTTIDDSGKNLQQTCPLTSPCETTAGNTNSKLSEYLSQLCHDADRFYQTILDQLYTKTIPKLLDVELQ